MYLYIPSVHVRVYVCTSGFIKCGGRGWLDVDVRKVLRIIA
jgi:hypothetical protein